VTNRNKKVGKLRRYRDKLITKNVDLEGKNRYLLEVLRVIRKALQKEDTLRAYALASEPDAVGDMSLSSFTDKNELAKELTLVYKMLVIERRYTKDIEQASHQRDYLRVAALCADHGMEWIAHDKMLNDWSQDHGFTRRLRQEGSDEIIV
jgi:hypothetical protein